MPVRCVDDPVVDADVVSMADLDEWSTELGEVLGRISSLFVHPSSRRRAEQYVCGLLSPIARKNEWTIAEYVGEKEPKAMQRFLNLATWDADGLCTVVCDYAMKHLADPRAVLVADPTGFAKKGRKSAGGQRQYPGTLGRIDNVVGRAADVVQHTLRWSCFRRQHQARPAAITSGVDSRSKP